MSAGKAVLPDRRLPNGLLHRDRVQRILVIKLRHFGDVLLTTPLLSTLRANYPNALIDVLVYDGTEAMLAGNRDVYLTYTVDRSLKRQSCKAQYRGEQALWNSLNTGHYDLVINLSDQWRAALYCRFLKPTFSLGFAYPKRNNRLWRACHSLLVPVDGHNQRHTVLNNLSILSLDSHPSGPLRHATTGGQSGRSPGPAGACRLDRSGEAVYRGGFGSDAYGRRPADAFRRAVRPQQSATVVALAGSAHPVMGRKLPLITPPRRGEHRYPERYLDAIPASEVIRAINRRLTSLEIPTSRTVNDTVFN